MPEHAFGEALISVCKCQALRSIPVMLILYYSAHCPDLFILHLRCVIENIFKVFIFVHSRRKDKFYCIMCSFAAEGNSYCFAGIETKNVCDKSLSV